MHTVQKSGLAVSGNIHTVKYYAAIDTVSYWYVQQDESQKHIKQQKLDIPKMCYMIPFK